MKVDEAYENWSQTYDTDQNFTRDLDEEVTSEIFKNQRFDSILEIGCGTGKNTRLFSEIGVAVQAIDFSSAMIEQARRKATSDNVAFTVADLTRAWPIADASIDLISCNLVLEHISDLVPVFAEAARVLVHHGRLFVSELHPFRQYQGVRARFERDSATIKIPAFVHHISDFFNAAQEARLSLVALNEWWHEEDRNKPPRLISLLFTKSDVVS